MIYMIWMALMEMLLHERLHRWDVICGYPVSGTTRYVSTSECFKTLIDAEMALV